MICYVPLTYHLFIFHDRPLLFGTQQRSRLSLIALSRLGTDNLDLRDIGITTPFTRR